MLALTQSVANISVAVAGLTVTITLIGCFFDLWTRVFEWALRTIQFMAIIAAICIFILVCYAAAKSIWLGHPVAAYKAQGALEFRQ